MEAKTYNKSGNCKQTLVAICILASCWMVMAVYAEDKKHNQNQNVPSPSAVSPESKKSANVVQTRFYPELTKHELKIQAAFNTEMECDFLETPLSEAMKLLADRHGITILVMENDLGEEGLTVDVPVSLKVKGISLRNVLDLMLEPHGLTYVVEQDVVKITSRVKAGAGGEYKIRVYPVGDFGNTKEDYQELINVILKATFWDYEGNFSLIKSSKVLVISQTYQAHNAIVELLTQLRQARALE